MDRPLRLETNPYVFTLVSVGRGYSLNELLTLGTLINTTCKSDAFQNIYACMMTLLVTLALAQGKASFVSAVFTDQFCTISFHISTLHLLIAAGVFRSALRAHCGCRCSGAAGHCRHLTHCAGHYLETGTHSLIHIDSFTHSFIYSITCPFTHLLTLTR